MEISTGEKLSENLVRTVYAIFDKNDDQKVNFALFCGLKLPLYQFIIRKYSHNNLSVWLRNTTINKSGIVVIFTKIHYYNLEKK